ncbi:hypothetical protein As57867_000902, partial [Aphanomyces stellatus]
GQHGPLSSAWGRRRQFDCPPLAPDVIDRLKFTAITNAKFIVDKTDLQSGLVRWSVHADETDVVIYKGIDPYASPGSCLYMSVTRVAAPLDTVIARLQGARNPLAIDQLESAPLYSLVEPTAEDPYDRIAVTWRGFRSPLARLVAERDCCLLECQHAFLMDGRRVWVDATKSTTVPACPDAVDAFVRIMNYGTGLVCIEPEPGLVYIRHLVHLHFRGDLTPTVDDSHRAWLCDAHMMRRCRALFLMSSLHPPRSRHCAVCLKMHRNDSPLVPCRCGQTLCHGCSLAWRACAQLEDCPFCFVKSDEGVTPPTSSSSSRLDTDWSSISIVHSSSSVVTSSDAMYSDTCVTNDAMSHYSDTVVAPLPLPPPRLHVPTTPPVRFGFWKTT